MEKRNLVQFLNKYREGDPISFHMPGHKGRSVLYDDFGYGELFRNAAEIDITEIPGADNLHRPTGAIREMEEGYAAFYGVAASRLLVNGGSAGVMAAVLAAVPRGGRLLMARNSHVSAYNAIRMGGITPVYVLPGEDGRIAAPEVERAIIESTPIDAVLITSPTYYGVISDIAAISEVAHRYGIPLIVDQAHGAHLPLFDKFFESVSKMDRINIFKKDHADTSKKDRVAQYRGDADRLERESEIEIPKRPLSAENCGADLIINSTHKTMLSFTGTAVLNINSELVSAELVTSWLSSLQTTSPSYIALASLEANLRIFEERGEDIVRKWLKGIEFFRYNAKRMERYHIASGPHIDPSKLYITYLSNVRSRADKGTASHCEEEREPAIDLLDSNSYYLDGNAIAEALMRRDIWPEMWDSSGVLLLTGPGNVRTDCEALLRALYEIDQAFLKVTEHTSVDRVRNADPKPNTDINQITETNPDQRIEAIPQFVGIPAECEDIPLYEAEGRVAAESIIPYPPGIPVVCPGEALSFETIKYLGELIASAKTVKGIDSEGRISVGREDPVRQRR